MVAEAVASTADAASYGTFEPPPSPRADAPRPTLSEVVRNASLRSRLFLLWFEDLVDLTKTRPVSVQDVWQLDDADRSARTHDRFVQRMKRPRDFVPVALRLYWRPLVTSAALSVAAAAAGVANPLLILIITNAVTIDRKPTIYVVQLLVLYLVLKGVFKLATHHSRLLRARVATHTLGALQTMLFDVTLLSTWSQDVTVSEASNMFHELTSLYEMIVLCHDLWILPIKLLVNLVLLYYIIGDAALGSLLAVVALQVLALLLKRVNKSVAEGLQKYKERRLQVMSECFKTILSIKLHAWEARFLSKIRALRRDERFVAQKLMLIDSAWCSVRSVLPEIIFAGSLMVLVSDEPHSFNPAAFFAGLAILNSVKRDFGNLQWMLYILVSSSLTLKRVIGFLETSQRTESKEARSTNQNLTREPEGEQQDVNQNIAVKIENAAISHREGMPVLVRVNLSVPAGSLTVIHGGTSEGKSSILEAIVDSELIVNSPHGRISTRGNVAFCSQYPWLQTLSIRENILFGLPYDEVKYLNVLHACCLIRDIEALHQGDATIIGPKGLTLSGGQKARIALARACYADADVYLLDSPLSSVDAIVQSDIFRRCFVGLLRDKTIMLVTHNVEIISSSFVDQVVHVQHHGLIVERAPSAKQTKSNRQVLLTQTNRRCPATQLSHYYSSALAPLVLSSLATSRIEHRWQNTMRKVSKVVDFSGTSLAKSAHSVSPLQSTWVYLHQCVDMARCLIPLSAFFIVSRGALVAAHVWICVWSWRISTDETSEEGRRNVQVFVVLLSVSSFAAFSAALFVNIRTGRMADKMFDRMAKGVLFAPMRFFNSQPIGEIMSRFSGDMVVLDDKLAYIRLESVFDIVGVAIMSLVLMYIFPEMLLAGPFAAWLMYMNRFQLRIASQVTQLVGSSYSPCYEAIAEAIEGRHVVQAFGAYQVMRFRQEHHVHIDELLLLEQVQFIMRSWGALQFFEIDILFIVAIIVGSIVRQDSEIPLFGLALHYAVTINENLFSLYASALEFLEATVNFRRVAEYGAVIPEKRDETVSRTTTVHLSSEWPSTGSVIFDNVSFQYDNAAGPVLKNIQLSILPGENIGIVGRTGSGKSSLTMALLRIYELSSGRILIDGVDISLIDLHELRARLSIVPQTPLFFKGPLRSYLDPFNTHDDATLWEALRKTGLANTVARLDGKLLAELYENAENLSLGERQLLCLSCLLLRRSRVVILDEATAAVDSKSDEVLQRVIKDEFQESTLISIAHRLDSILEFDRVVVVEDGRIVQCGRVEKLVADVDGPFFDLLEGALLKM